MRRSKTTKEKIAKGARWAVERLARLRRDASGASLVAFAVALPAIVGFSGLGIDAATWYNAKHRLQSATDYAALAGAVDKSASGGTLLASHVHAVLTGNGVNVGRLSELTINTPPASGAYTGDNDAVEIIATEQAMAVFSSLIVQETPVVRARSVARVDGAGLSCVLALNPSLANAVTFGGASSTLLTGCGIATNSSHNRSISTTGAATINATSIYTAGDVSGNGFSTTTGIRTHQAPLDDPYGDVEVPAFSGCTANNLAISGTATLQPGVYCGGIDFNSGANVWLQPGVYVIDRGNVSAGSNAIIRGDGVTLIYTSSTGADYGTFTGHGGATLELSAPNEGPFAGLLMFGDRNVPAATAVSINGNQHSRFHGAIYFPNQPISYSGNFTFANGCIQLIASTISFGGSSSMEVPARCTDNALKAIGTLSVVLVE